MDIKGIFALLYVVTDKTAGGIIQNIEFLDDIEEAISGLCIYICNGIHYYSAVLPHGLVVGTYFTEMGGKFRKEKASIYRWVSDRVAGQAIYSVTTEATYMTMPGINVEVNEVSELEQDM